MSTSTRPNVAIRELHHGFTLVELLIVIGIISVLIGLLLPAIIGARRQARFIRCAANMHQIGQAFFVYAANRGAGFPPNVSGTNPAYWCDQERIGGYVSAPLSLGMGMGGGVLQCPDDDDGKRSYAMNATVSGNVDSSVLKKLAGKALWDRHSLSSQVILLAEAYSSLGSDASGYCAPYTIGVFGATPGQRFGAGIGISPAVDENRFGMQITELAFGRHPTSGGSHVPGGRPLANERLNFAYADGHVEQRSASELANLETGESTGKALWSPLDVELSSIATVSP